MEAAALLVVLVVAAVAAVVAGYARRQRAAFVRANEVVPGVASDAPPAWAGDHSPEARLHRRLRDAVAAMHANPASIEPGLFEVRSAVEAEALVIDRHLVAVAALPERLRAGPLAGATRAVGSLEDTVAAAAVLPDAGGSLGAANERLAALAEARRELDALVAPRLAVPDPSPEEEGRAPPEGSPAGG